MASSSRERGRFALDVDFTSHEYKEAYQQRLNVSVSSYFPFLYHPAKLLC